MKECQCIEFTLSLIKKAEQLSFERPFEKVH